MSNLINFLSNPPDRDLVKMLENLLAEAKEGKVGNCIVIHDTPNENATATRYLYLVEGGNLFSVLGMLYNAVLDFRDFKLK